MDDKQLSRDGRFQWSETWQTWVPTGREDVIDVAPLDVGPLLPDRHPEGCWCDECFNMGQRMADYLKNRGLWGNGGLK